MKPINEYDVLYKRKVEIEQKLRHANEEYLQVTKEIEESGISETEKQNLNGMLSGDNDYLGFFDENQPTAEDEKQKSHSKKQTQAKRKGNGKVKDNKLTENKENPKEHLAILKGINQKLKNLKKLEETIAKREKRINNKNIKETVNVFTLRQYGSFFAQIILFLIGLYFLYVESMGYGVFFTVFTTITMTAMSYSFKLKGFEFSGQNNQDEEKNNIMSISKAKNLYIAACLVSLISGILAVSLYFSGSFANQEVIVASMAGLSCGLLSFIIILTRAGVLMAIIKDIASFCKEVSSKDITYINTKNHNEAAV